MVASVDRLAGVAPETAARTDDEVLGTVGSRGVAQAPMADTDTAGAVGCEVRAGASDAEGCGMDASVDFEVFGIRREPASDGVGTTEPVGVVGVRPAGPGMLAAQIEERCAELVFLRTVRPQGQTQPAGVAPEMGARTEDEALGGVGSQGVARGPMVDTCTAGTVECEVQAGAGDAEGCGMDASDYFEVFERAATSELSAHGMEGSGAARELRGGVGRCYAAIDTASGVAVLAVADGDVTRSTGAIFSKK